jgi:hypothetical protein
VGRWSGAGHGEGVAFRVGVVRQDVDDVVPESSSTVSVSSTASGGSFTHVTVTLIVAVLLLSCPVVSLEREGVGAAVVGVRRIGVRAGRGVRDRGRAVAAVGDDGVGQRVAVDVGRDERARAGRVLVRGEAAVLGDRRVVDAGDRDVDGGDVAVGVPSLALNVNVSVPQSFAFGA